MPTPAEVWEQYQPRFAEAKLLDSREQTLVFLVQPVKVGRFWVVPLTLRRLLFLEAYGNPFVGGAEPPSRAAIIELIWVLSPNFSPSRWRRKVFFMRNRFINADKYGEAVVTVVQAAIELMAQSGRDADPSPLWVAQLVDIYASEYGWGLEEILDTPFLKLNILGRAMGVRMAAKSGDSGAKVENNRNVDAVRAQYLKEVNEVAHG